MAAEFERESWNNASPEPQIDNNQSTLSAAVAQSKEVTNVGSNDYGALLITNC
jgi:hypothetical protein